MFRPFAAIAAIFIATTAMLPQVQEKPPCDQFAWSLDKVRIWFGGALNVVESGARIDPFAEGAFTAKLGPLDKVRFVLPPEGQPKEGKPNGAIVSFGPLAKTGRCQVTLSDEAWIDLIQNNAYAKAVEHTGVHGCSGLRKSVRFDLQRGPLVLQLSAASASQLSVSIRPVE